MSVLPSDLVAYGSAYMPEADGTSVGGAVDFSRRVAFYDITPAGTINFVSSSATDADSSDVARSFRDHVARCSDMMSPA
jgi:hypothetical protein